MGGAELVVGMDYATCVIAVLDVRCCVWYNIRVF